MIKSLFKNKNNDGITSIDTLFMSLASKIGIGSLAGISFAIYYGGIGVLFWIWVFSFFISITSYLENYFSILYKKKDGNYYKGGPAYYIKYGLNNTKLSYIYAIILIFTYIVGFLTIQNNTITKLFYINYDISTIIISFIITTISSYFIFNGLKSISNLCNKIVPIMSVIYFVIGIIIFVLNINDISIFLKDVINSAFNYKSFFGAFIVGIQKSIFSSEAGMGTGGIASGSSSCDNPQIQGFMGVISTYFINIIISFITGIIIFFSNYRSISFSNINGIELTNYSFNYHLGEFGEVILLILIILFAFSTIVTGYYYVESNLKIFTSKKSIISILKVTCLLLLFIGGIIPSNIIWELIDIFVGILSIINIYSIYKLSFNKCFYKT